MNDARSLRSLNRFKNFLIVLSVLIIGLMALGAGVRTMNAGLSCPDWPLCFGQVIPDFHIGVWFEFVHRAYAGVVALLFAGCVVYALRSKVVPHGAKSAAKLGAVFLVAQIVMGGLTVLLLVKAVIVTAHLLLATLFLACVLWMYFSVRRYLLPFYAAAQREKVAGTSGYVLLPILVFGQIAVGGLVASTYAGSVCVDWPLCNGQWVPTIYGAIGLQIFHRFFAYGLVLIFLGLAIRAWLKRVTIDPRIRKLLFWCAVTVLAQTTVGILNLLYYIPPHITVPHQTLAMILFGLCLKIWFEAISSGNKEVRRRFTVGSPVALSAPPFETQRAPRSFLGCDSASDKVQARL